MARIDALLQHMTQNGASRAVLNADASSILESDAGAQQGKPLAGAQIEAMLDEVMPAQARQNLQNVGRADFVYSAPSGTFNLSATQPDGEWHLEIAPAATVADAQPDGVAASQEAASSVAADKVVIAPVAVTPTLVAPESTLVAPEPAPVELAKRSGPPRFDPSASVAPPPSPPDAATPSGGYPPAGAPTGNNAYANDSGRGDASVLPAELQGFNWGALFGSWIWGLGNSVWLGLLCLVPCVGFFMRFFLGARGSEMAWKSKRWESIQAFRSAQVTWGVVGGLVTVGGLLFMAVPAAVLFPVFARARENARRSSCQDNLKQVGLAVMKYSKAHNETLPTGTTMAEWKPQLQPYLNEAGGDPIFVCPSHQGTGESYQINPKMSGLNLYKINDAAQTPMIYETKSDLHLEGSSILFADGHVKFFREEKMRELTKDEG